MDYNTISSDNTNETEPLVAKETSRRALTTAAGATVLALCLAAAVVTQSPSYPKSSLATGKSDLLPKFIHDLNTQMRQSKNFHKDNKKNVYEDGYNIGVLVRALDDGQTIWFSDANPPTSPNCGNTNCLAVSTFWHNDLQGISQMYSNDPWCPQNVDGHHDCTGMDNWDKPVLGVVVGSMFTYLLEKSGMPSKNQGSQGVDEYLQDDNWGYGVLYPHDSNAADKRCIFLDIGGGEYMYDCPGFYIPSTADGKRGDGVWDSSKLGSGGYPAGNYVTNWGGGGGSGCHMGDWMNPPNVDQFGMTDGTGGRDSLVEDANCQCHYLFKDDWSHWVEWATTYWNEGPSSGINPGYNPSWLMDNGICWMNNFKDMIRLQNQLYWTREDYLDGSIPWTAFDFVGDWWKSRQYWGWNEVPVDATTVNDPGTWDALLITLPAFTCPPKGDYQTDYLFCMSDDAKKYLDAQLEKYEKEGALVPGKNNAASRPGSSVAIARQSPDNPHPKDMDQYIGWTREFYCEDYETDKYKIVWKKEKDENKAGCYIVKK